MTIREVLTWSLARAGKDLPLSVQVLGWVAYFAVGLGLAWLGYSVNEYYGWLVGLVLGLALGIFLATSIFRRYRAVQPKID